MQNGQKSLITDFTKGPVLRQLLTFATPLFLSNLLQMVYNMVDMVIVGQAMGSVGLSAVSVGGDLVSFLTVFAMGLTNAGQVLIAQRIGKGQQHTLGRFIGTMFTFLMSAAILFSIVGLIFRDTFLAWMNTPPESFSEAGAYARCCMTGLVFIYGYNIVSAVLRGMGDAKHPFIFISLAAILNVVLDLAFVLGLHMGAFGAALATVLSQGVSFAACAVFILKNRRRYALDFVASDFLHLDRESLSSLVRLGIPMAIKNASVSFSKLFVNAFINSFGVAASAFSGIANKLAVIANLVSNAFNAAGSSMIGQNIGARTYDRIRRIMLGVFAITGAASIVFSLALAVFPEFVFGLFTSDQEVIAIGIRYIPIGILMFMGSTARSGSNALINGSGNYKVNYATAILDGIVFRIGFALLFGLLLEMGPYGFWLGDALAGYTPFWIGLIFYFRGSWKQEADKP